MESELRTNLRTLADLYATAKGMELVSVAQSALGDWRFFKRLEDKETASFTVRKYDSAVAWFSARWPSDLTWPEGIVRPEVNQAA